jgi:hypothetical protein
VDTITSADDGEVSVDNNHLGNLIRPWAMGCRAWLFAGSELAGQRAAVVMSLVQSAKLHGRDPWAYLNDLLTRLPTHLNSRIDELLLRTTGRLVADRIKAGTEINGHQERDNKPLTSRSATSILSVSPGAINSSGQLLRVNLD